MLAKTKKQESFDSFAKRYKPLKVRLLGLTLRERYPRLSSLLKPWATIQVRLYIHMGIPINYFHMRPLLPIELRKSGDMRFITHYLVDHAENKENTQLSERVWFFWLHKVVYGLELSYVTARLREVSKTQKTSKQADDYIVRWGYLLYDQIDPSYTEFIHGTEPVLAKDSLDSLI